MKNSDALKQFEYYCEKGKNTICPFSGKTCTKIKRADIGICSVNHLGKQQIICPAIFNKIDCFSIIANELLGINDYRIIKELKIGDNFIDYILVDKFNYSNYCGIEYQSLDTSGNYRYLFGEKVKPFCINWKATKKTILSQLLTKTPIFSGSKKRIVLVIQDTFSDYLGISNFAYDKNKDIQVLILCYKNSRFSHSYFVSLDLLELQSLFDMNCNIDLNMMVEQRLLKYQE